MSDEITGFTDEQLRAIAEWTSQIAQTFVCEVRSQVQENLQSAVIRSVCGIVLGTQVASGADSDAIRIALRIAVGMVAGDFDPSATEVAPQDGPAVA